MQFPDRLARVIFAQLTAGNAGLAQRVCEAMPLAMGLEPFNAWHQKLERLGLPQSRYDFMTSPHGDKPVQVVINYLPDVQHIAEAKFLAGVIGVIDTFDGRQEELLAAWDVMLERLGLTWQEIDFDIIDHLGLARTVAAAA